MAYQADDSALVKKPHVKTPFTDEQLVDFAKTADRYTGAYFFMGNFFWIQHPVKGKLLYQAFPYQHALLQVYHENRFSINMLSRQTGKTTTAAGYLLWYAMFVPDSTILVAAHKYDGAQEIMQRIRYAYENCPDHVRAGVTSYNKGSIEFDNGSRIQAQTTTETTGRGLSISLLYVDEFAYVRPTIATEFWTSISPTLSTGGRAIITSTPNSDEDQFALIWKGANKREDEYGNETELGVNGFKAFKAIWKEHPERDEKWADEERGRIGDERFRREHLCLAYTNMLTLQTQNGEIITKTIGDLHKELTVNNKKYKVLTSDGFKDFAGVSLMGNKPGLRLEFEDGIWVECTYDHKIFINNNTKLEAKNIRVGDTVLTTNGDKKLINIIEKASDNVYDLIEVEDVNRFYANDVLVSNCEFIINDETLINATKLFDLEGVAPLFKHGQVRWYKKPEPGKMYCIALDPSLGTGGDPAAIQVFEAGSITQVAEWRHNKSTIPQQIRIMHEIITYINDEIDDPQSIYYTLENNTIGEASLISLAEFGEEQFPGMMLSETKKAGVGRRFRKGFTTTNKSKLTACAKMKTLIETGKLTVNSSALVSELKGFVAHGTSYAAKPGGTDDLVMSTVLIIRMLQTLQNYHPELSNNIKDYNDSVIEPMPFILF